MEVHISPTFYTVKGFRESNRRRGSIICNHRRTTVNGIETLQIYFLKAVFACCVARNQYDGQKLHQNTQGIYRPQKFVEKC